MFALPRHGLPRTLLSQADNSWCNGSMSGRCYIHAYSDYTFALPCACRCDRASSPWAPPCWQVEHVPPGWCINHLACWWGAACSCLALVALLCCRTVPWQHSAALVSRVTLFECDTISVCFAISAPGRPSLNGSSSHLVLSHGVDIAETSSAP